MKTCECDDSRVIVMSSCAIFRIGNTHQRCYIISPDSSCIGSLLISKRGIIIITMRDRENLRDMYNMYLFFFS